jgi:hypothetical protein
MRIIPLRSFYTIVWLFCLVPLAWVHGQGEARNMIRNPSFESASARANLWYGTSQDGTLQVQAGQVPVLTASGSIANTAMPASVSLGDLNGDGLLDLLVGGVDGYMYVYFNSGSSTEPKFTTGELLPVYLPQLPTPEAPDQPLKMRAHAPRVHLADIANTGRKDIWIGNYSGMIIRLPNSGSAAAPAFAQPRDIRQVLIPTTADPTRRWGNVFAPALWDFDGNGVKDLLVGEGSYSANSIHILLNQGSNASPRFLDTNRHVLAYGMGREQLTPAVVDYNGNGQPDLLVADRSGKIGLYSSSIASSDAEVKEDNIATGQAGGQIASGGTWKPGEHLPFVSYLQAGGVPLQVPGIPTVAAGDLTGNGAFDLVLGLNNGRVMLAKNTGTKEEPKFSKPELVKGEPTPAVFNASGWEINAGHTRGNFFGLASVVNNEQDAQAQPPDGQRALRLAYAPNRNSVIKSNFVWPGHVGQYRRLPMVTGATPQAPAVTDASASNIFTVEQKAINLELGAKYTMSFQIKGRNVISTEGAISSHRRVVLQQARQEQVGRGAVRNVGGENLEETFLQPIAVRVGPNWNTISVNFTFAFQDRRLNEPEGNNRNHAINFILIFELAAPNGEVYLDNFSLIKN